MKVLDRLRVLNASPSSGCAGGLVGCEVSWTFRKLSASPSSGCSW